MSFVHSWLIASLRGFVKALIIVATGEAAGHLFPSRYDLAFGVGLLLGVVFQLPVPTNATWKKQLLVLVPLVIIVALVHAYLR
jgi:hypothetical protein